MLTLGKILAILSAISAGKSILLEGMAGNLTALGRGEHGPGWSGPPPNPRTNPYSVGPQFLRPRTDPIEPGTKDRTDPMGSVRFQG